VWYLICQPLPRIQASEPWKSLRIGKERHGPPHPKQENLQRARKIYSFRISLLPCRESTMPSTLGIHSNLFQDDPTFKPKARLQNPRNKPITIQRGINLITLNPSSSTELWDGDAIHLVGGITVVFVAAAPRKPITTKHAPLTGYLGIHFVAGPLQPLRWTRSPVRVSVCIWFDFGLATSLINFHRGIHVVHSSCPEVTHTIVQELVLTPSCMLSLLNSKVVTPSWLAEVIRRGIAGNPSSTLEQHFELPHTSSYLPTVSAALPSTLSRTDVWITGTNRRGILDDYRFIIFTRNSECAEDFQSIISVFGGGYELFPVDSGRTRLHRRLSVDKDKRKKVIVVDDEVKASIPHDTWNELIDEAKPSVLSHPPLFVSLNHLNRFELTFSSREQILETILVGNTSALSQYPGLCRFPFASICSQFDLCVTAARVPDVSSQLHHGYPPQGRIEGSSGPKQLTSTPPSLDQEHSPEVEPPKIRRVGLAVCIQNCGNCNPPGAHSPSQSWFSASYGRRLGYSGGGPSR